MKAERRENMWFFAWAVAVVAMCGSLYFSEIRGYEPCELCWYQRILMYPMAILIGISVVRKEYRLSLYTTVLSGIGMFVSLYHYSLQKFSIFSDHSPACGRVPCTAEYINWLGFITIPFLALTAFILIFISSLLVWKWTTSSSNPS
ncbi:disulfide oxidoreductase [Heyndrickxia acidiproducens]|uniref:disulfide oxidoreductase n=1 Tax=Heyndrickxia acidiproducens TaxID=1121084 RepID=UPI00036801C6|nr:disulfide oxidoreductase [Heyndrickxia acidiproducens]